MDNLHLSFREVYEGFSYLLLVLMSADKQRVASEESEESKIKIVSGKEMMKKKRGG